MAERSGQKRDKQYTYYHSDDDPDAIYIFPEDAFDNGRDRDTASSARSKPKSSATTDTGELMYPPPREKVITSTEELIKQQKNALLLGTLIESHPNQKDLIKNDKGIIIRTNNSGTTEIVYTMGITTPLSERFWPNKRYTPLTKVVSRKTGQRHVPGGIRHAVVGVEVERKKVVVSKYTQKNNSDSDEEDDDDDDILNIGEDGEEEGPVVSRSSKKRKREDSPIPPDAEIEAPKPKRSLTTIIHDAISRGTATHKRMEIFHRVYISKMQNKGNTDGVAKSFAKQLRLQMGETEIPKDVEIALDFYNSVDLQFIPVATEVPVCDMKKLPKKLEEITRKRKEAADAKKVVTSPYFRKPPEERPFQQQQRNQSIPLTSPARFIPKKDDYVREPYPQNTIFASSIDALGFHPSTGKLVAIEFKTSTGDFFKSKVMMKPPFDIYQASALNCAIIQHVLAMELFKRTYGLDIIGYIILIGETKEDSRIIKISVADQKEIVRLLLKTEFLAKH